MKPLKYIILALALVTSVFAGPEQLIGKWQSKDKKEITEFLPDGSFVSMAGLIGVKGRYECYGENQLRLSFESKDALPAMEFKYAVTDDSLRLENAQKKVVEFTKVKKE